MKQGKGVVISGALWFFPSLPATTGNGTIGGEQYAANIGAPMPPDAVRLPIMVRKQKMAPKIGQGIITKALGMASASGADTPRFLFSQGRQGLFPRGFCWRCRQQLTG